MNEESMKFRQGTIRGPIGFVVPLLMWWCLLAGLTVGQEQSATKVTTAGVKTFDTPQQAADALIKAAGAYDVAELMAIFGPDGKDFVASADPVEDKNNAVAFATEASAKHSISIDPAK